MMLSIPYSRVAVSVALACSVAFVGCKAQTLTADASDVAILYDGWRLSGLSTIGYPIRLQIEERDGVLRPRDRLLRPGS